MPSIAVRTFTDPDDYAETIRGGIVELTVTGRGDFSAKLTRIDLHRLWTQRFSENLSRVVHAANAPMAAMSAPLLILIGEADAWNPAEACRWLEAHARPDAEKVELVVYPGAHHAFDIVAFNPGRSLRGRWVEYNEAAAKDAEEKTRAFLDAHLVEISPGEPTAK